MHPPPCSGFRGLSWGCVVLRGRRRARLGWLWVPTRPVRRSAPCGYSANTPSRSRSRGRPSMDLRSSSELDHRDPVPSRRLRGRSDDTSSPGLLLPYDTYQTGGSVPRRRIPPPPRAAYGVWLPPARPSTTGPPDASSASERPWASPYKGFPSSRSVPLSRSVPSCRYPPPLRLPGGQRARRSRLQGLVPVTNPC
jgi:hypothetical protein